MSKILKNSLLKYLPLCYEVESAVNRERIFDYNYKTICKGDVVYLMERELRSCDNFAIQFGLTKAKELKSDLKIVHPYIKYEHKPKQKFVDEQIKYLIHEFRTIGVKFEVVYSDIEEYLLKSSISILIIDFNPISNKNYLDNANYKIYEIDGHNIIPARYVSDKQEYSAATFRRKVYKNIYPFITNYISDYKSEIIDKFIKNKLSCYADYKNNPLKNCTSGLSKYLNLGFISSQRVVTEVLKSKESNINKEAFLEEIIVRKELSDNFCLYNKKFKTFDGIPQWAKMTLNNHRSDLREYIYSKQEFENAQTHDELWNATQKQLIRQGIIHGYLRMYWAKKIAEWSISPEYALNIAIYLNDKYACDAPSSSGYVNILWAIGGLHDRAFKDWKVTGKIRRMTYNSIKSKFRIRDYIAMYQ